MINTINSSDCEVDLPEPFLPITNVVGEFLKFISIGVLPVDRKFLYLIFLNTIIIFLCTHLPLCQN